MKLDPFSKTAVALFLVLTSACAEQAAAPVDEPDQTDPDDPVEPDPEVTCTPDNDVVPMDEIVAAMAGADSGLVGAIARAKDGTVYFVSYWDLDRAEISRRAPCSEIETNWLSISAPISELEITSDNQLYMGASGAGSVNDIEARLYRLDLDDNTAFPEVLVREPGQTIVGLTAAPNGRLFFHRGFASRAIYYVDGDTVKLAKDLAIDTSGFASIAAAPDGSVIVFRHTGYPSTKTIGRLVISASGTATLTNNTIPAGSSGDYRMMSLRADGAGGFYATKVTGAFSSQTYSLMHTTTLTGAHSMVGDVANVNHARVAYAVDGDAKSAAFLSPKTAEPITAVTLPVAVRMP